MLLDLDAQTFLAFLRAHWLGAVAAASGFAGLTATGLGLLNRARKDEIALWMMGAESEQDWSRSFCAIFDAVFGTRHLSLRCIGLSALASILSVTAIWLLIGTAQGLGTRLALTLSLGQVLVYGLAINAVADYLSLYETRWLLGRMHRLRAWWLQILVLLLDLALTAAIIWGVIWAVQRLPFFDLEGAGFAEVAGIFSPLAVFFYSTFLTSVWVWFYILSTWLMRALARLRLDRVLAVETEPVKILAAIVFAAVLVPAFLGSAALAALIAKDATGLTAKDATGLTAIDRGLCSVFKGPVCLHVRGLTEDENTRLALTLDSCAGGVTLECFQGGLDSWESDAALAAQYWRVACDAGDAQSCTNLGILHRQGIGMAADPAGMRGAAPISAISISRGSGCRRIRARRCGSSGRAATAGMRRAAPVSAISISRGSGWRRTRKRRRTSIAGPARWAGRGGASTGAGLSTTGPARPRTRRRRRRPIGGPAIWARRPPVRGLRHRQRNERARGRAERRANDSVQSVRLHIS